MQITLIRHLPTEWNQKTWLQGRRDIGIADLTEEVQKEIEQNLQILKKNLPIEKILTSTLTRTHQTAHLYGFIPETESLLDELDFGPFEGLPKGKLLETYGNKWIDNPKSIILGESISNLEKRIVLFLDKYKELTNLLVFGHGSWIRAFVSYYHYGHINNMNKISVRNNEYMHFNIDFKKRSDEIGGSFNF